MNNEVVKQATNELQKCLRNWKQELQDAWHQKPESDAERLHSLEELVGQNGADLNYLERERGLALLPHVFWCEDLIKFFVDRGADVNSRDENGDTAMHLALRNAHHLEWKEDDGCPKSNPVNIIKFLLESSADPNVANLKGENALFTLIKEGFKGSEEDKIMEFVNLFQERGAKVDTSNRNGESMLHLLSYRSDNLFSNDVFNEEFAEGQDVDARTSNRLYSQTPLMLAARNGRLEYSKLLVERGADVNATDLQGYTALHHAVCGDRGLLECAEFLVNMGADPNAKSLSGRNAYDLNVYGLFKSTNVLFGYRATPAKQGEMFEIAGAKELIWQNIFRKSSAIRVWDKAMKIYKESNLQPSQEFLTNYEFLKENLENPEANEEIRQSALNTVARLTLSQGIMSRFWFLLSLTQYHEDNPSYSFRAFDILEEELKRAEDFASIEEVDFDTLAKFSRVCFFHVRIPPERISQLHSIAKLIIACFDKLTQVTNSKMVLSKNGKLIYVLLYNILVKIGSQFADVMSKEAFNDNERLLRSLFDLDLRDQDNGDSLLHIILKRKFKNITSEMAVAILDFADEKVASTRNLMGFEPSQYIKRGEKWSDEDIKKIAARGAHVDARNVSNGPTLMQIFLKRNSNEWFRYDSLQCACARFLARSLIPYENTVPKHMVEFIRNHLH